MKQVHRLTATWLALLIFGATAGCDRTDHGHEALAATETAVALTYESLAGAAKGITDATDELCEHTSAPNVEAARQAWQDTMALWQQAHVVRFGPVRHDDRVLRIQFWPDPRDLVARNIDDLLKYDPAAPLPQIDVESIHDGSVALQGLPALEYLLYGNGQGPGVIALRYAADPQRCELTRAVAAHLAQVTNALYQEWLHHPGRLTQYGQEEGHFANRQAAVSAVLNSVIETGEDMASSKLAWPLGERVEGQPQPLRTESRRSANSLANIQNNLAGMARFLTAGEAGGLLALAGRSGASNADIKRVKTLLTQAREQAGQAPPLAAGLRSGDNLAPYRTLLETARSLNSVLSERIAPALDVQVGFNFNDGD